MLMLRKQGIAVVVVFIALSGFAYGDSGGISGGTTGSSAGSTGNSAKTQSGLGQPAPVNTGTEAATKSRSAGTSSQSLGVGTTNLSPTGPAGTNPATVVYRDSVGTNPSPSVNPAAGVGNKTDRTPVNTGGLQSAGVNTSGNVQPGAGVVVQSTPVIQTGPGGLQSGGVGQAIGNAVTGPFQVSGGNVSPRKFSSAWMSFGPFFMLLLVLILGLEALRLQRLAMPDEKDHPSSEGFVFLVLALAGVAVLISALLWLNLEGQYLYPDERSEALGRAILFNPEVLAPGLLMASIVAGALALTRFWFAGVALGLSGHGRGEGMRSPWMALGGGILTLISLAGSLTTLTVNYWPSLLGR